MKAAAMLALALCAACGVAGPVVDEFLPPPPGPELGYILACVKPPSCEGDFEIETTLSELRSLDWEGREARDEDAGVEDILEPQDIDWREARVVLASDEPIEVALDEAPEEGTLIELHGPVTLRLQGIERVEGLRVMSTSADSVLVLDHVTTFDLILGDAEHRFAGLLDARHSAFERASVHAERIELDSAVFYESYVSAGNLVARDGLFEDIVLELGEALFAPSEIRKTRIQSCDALTFFGSNLWNVHIPRCRGEEPTRLYGSKVVVGVLDGVISADSTRLEALRVGRYEPTSLLSWAETMMRMAFCDFADDVKIEPGAAQCSDCTEGAFEEAVCKLPQDVIDERPGSSAARFNFCEALDEAERCEMPYPDRPRPHTNEE